MILKIKDQSIIFDNEKISISYIEQTNTVYTQNPEFAQRVVLTIRNNVNNSLGYLANIWETELKNHVYFDENMTINLIDSLDNPNITITNIHHIDYRIDARNGIIEESINVYK